MWPPVPDAPSAIQLFTLITGVLMGISHLAQPALWGRFFALLLSKGDAGLVANNLINATLGAAMVTLHQVWSGPAILVSLYGWALLLKAVIALWVPALGMRSLRLAERGDAGFRIAGIGMLVIAVAAALALAGWR